MCQINTRNIYLHTYFGKYYQLQIFKIQLVLFTTIFNVFGDCVDRVDYPSTKQQHILVLERFYLRRENYLSRSRNTTCTRVSQLIQFMILHLVIFLGKAHLVSDNMHRRDFGSTPFTKTYLTTLEHQATTLSVFVIYYPLVVYM